MFKYFGFEKELVNETVVNWVSKNHNSIECRKVIDAHEKAVRLRTKVCIDLYEQALRELWVVRPWETAPGLFLFDKPCTVPGGIVV